MAFKHICAKIQRQTYVLLWFGVVTCVLVLIVLSLCNMQYEQPSLDYFQVRQNDVTELAHKHYSKVTYLLVVVMSAPSHFDVRNVIRKTWAKDIPSTAAVVFVIGCKNLNNFTLVNLEQEQSTYKDVVLLNDIEESYNTLTKKLLSTLKWVSEHVKFNFLLKVDEDSFVRVSKVSEELSFKPKERLYWGFFDGRAHVKKKGKWAEKDYILCDRYIPYALGGGYMISKDLVLYISKNSELLKLFNSEDVSLGTWLGSLEIHRIHEPNFDTEYKSRGCFNSYLITHKKSPEELWQLQHNLETLGRLCVKEHRVRYSYSYNWESLPTNCCERLNTSLP